MGTRSLTTVKENGQVLVNIYRQYDGYLSGHGRDLAAILADRKMVNGIPGGADATLLFNGAGCMAAQIVHQLKDSSAGGIYITLPGDNGDYCDYVYELNVNSMRQEWDTVFSEPTVTVYRHGDEIFTGTVAEFDQFTQKEETYD
jgi:hypothetical protein